MSTNQPKIPIARAIGVIATITPQPITTEPIPETRTAATTNDTTHSERKNPAYLELIKCMCWPANSCIPHFSRDQLTSHKIGTTCGILSSVTCFFMPYSPKKGMAISAITFYMLRGMQETNFCSNMCPPNNNEQ